MCPSRQQAHWRRNVQLRAFPEIRIGAMQKVQSHPLPRRVCLSFNDDSIQTKQSLLVQDSEVCTRARNRSLRWAQGLRVLPSKPSEHPNGHAYRRHVQFSPPENEQGFEAFLAILAAEDRTPG